MQFARVRLADGIQRGIQRRNQTRSEKFESLETLKLGWQNSLVRAVVELVVHDSDDVRYRLSEAAEVFSEAAGLREKDRWWMM